LKKLKSGLISSNLLIPFCWSRRPHFTIYNSRRQLQSAPALGSHYIKQSPALFLSTIASSIIASMSQFLLLLASLLWSQFAFAQVPRIIELNVSWIKAAPDGFERDVITFNGVWPPEAIRVRKDEIYILKVYNGLNDGECITVHSHGIDQWGSNPYDGVDQVTQWYYSLFVISLEFCLVRGHG